MLHVSQMVPNVWPIPSQEMRPLCTALSASAVAQYVEWEKYKSYRRTPYSPTLHYVTSGSFLSSLLNRQLHTHPPTHPHPHTQTSNFTCHTNMYYTFPANRQLHTPHLQVTSHTTQTGNFTFHAGERVTSRSGNFTLHTNMSLYTPCRQTGNFTRYTIS